MFMASEKSQVMAFRGITQNKVIACIHGRGFGVRREDMKKMILATRGKVFTVKTLDRLIECTRLREYKANQSQLTTFVL
jgi:hypothetical protein